MYFQLVVFYAVVLGAVGDVEKSKDSISAPKNNEDGSHGQGNVTR